MCFVIFSKLCFLFAADSLFFRKKDLPIYIIKTMQHDVKLRMNKKRVLGGNCEEIH